MTLVFPEVSAAAGTAAEFQAEDRTHGFLRQTSLGVYSSGKGRGRMTETCFWLKDFKWMASWEGHLRPAPELLHRGRALLASEKLLFLFPSSLGWVLTPLNCCRASTKDPYWIHNLQRVPSQVQGNKGAQRRWVERAVKERQWCQLLLCKAHWVHTHKRLVIWGGKVEGKTDESCQSAEDKSDAMPPAVLGVT